MPQLVKGGKYVYGWSEVYPEGKIVIPPEAYEDYGFQTGENIILIPGSRTSGGFSLTSSRLLEGSPLSAFLKEIPQLSEFIVGEGTLIKHNKRVYSWLRMHNGHIIAPLPTLESYKVGAGSLLLSVRGSSLTLGFLTKGPLYELAHKHQNIAVF